MNTISIDDVIFYVENNISSFHIKRLQSLEKLKLKKILQRKNPYLFRAKNIFTAQDLVKELLDAFLQSQEETMFGGFLENLAIFICEKIFDGKKSTLIGIDLEFEREDVLYLVEIKSGPNWANSSQTKKMRDNFKHAIELRSKSNKKVVAVNGCCYGQEKQTHKDGYLKICGQEFWEFISGNNNLYLEIIEPLGHKAKQKNEEFYAAYCQIINQFTAQFMVDFCKNGVIDWEILIKFNSEKN